MSYMIAPSDVPRIETRVVVEGANMPTLPAAEAALAERGILVVPDFLANVMTNAWWWWVVFGDVAPTAEASFTKIASTMERLITTVAGDAERTGASLRTSAQALADHNAAAALARSGAP